MPDEFNFARLRLDLDGLRRGRYADPPYLNIVSILSALARSDHSIPDPGQSLKEAISRDASFAIADAIAETHWIVRRQPYTLLAGINIVLAMLSECTGFFDEQGSFVNTAGSLHVEAMKDGEIIRYDGKPMEALPVIIIRGRYRDFALLKTPILGTLARASRVATNTYRILAAAKGKPVYTFCARYDPPEVQAIDGYAYHVAVNRYNQDHGTTLPDAVSTYKNAEWWGGSIEGTISHEAIACFLGDLSELMISFAETLPVDRIRVALVDFHNDCVADTREVLWSLFKKYRLYVDSGEVDRALRYKLHGVRVDTSKELLDRSLTNDPVSSDFGPSPRLIRSLREVIDTEWRRWNLPIDWRSRAEQWCREVKIMVSGGVTEEKIDSYEKDNVPIDCYGVGSALLSNCSERGTMTDFSSVIMKIRVGNSWVDVAKVGRFANQNPLLKEVELFA